MSSNFCHTVMVLDIGVLHMGVCVAEVSEDFSQHNILWVDLVNITKFVHRDIQVDECPLYHSRNFADWIDHFVLEHLAFFEAADVILIEKQPPQGFVVVEQLIFSRWRHKTQLISPRQVHAYFHFGDADYEKRKQFAIKIADRELPPALLEQSHFYVRRHDIADCVCMLLFYMRRKARDWKREKRKEAFERMMWNNSEMTVAEKLDTFRYVE